jgi:hypothetical protein
MVDRSATNYRNYYYWVVTRNSESESVARGPDLGYLKNPLPTPTGLIAHGEVHGRVRLTWNEVSGANSYHVFRVIPGGSDLELVGVSPIPEFEDDSAAPGVTYRYSVRAYAEFGAGEYSSHSSAVSAEVGFVQVDLAVGRSPSALSGSGIIDPGGARQAIVLKSSKRRPLNYHTHVSNRGSIAATGRLTAPRANRMFRTTHMQLTPAPANISAAIAAGGSAVNLAKEGGSVSIQTTVAPAPAAKKKRSKTLKHLSWIRGEAIERPGIYDTIRVQGLFSK